MSKEPSKQDLLAKVLEKDSRYPVEAYHFVSQAVKLIAREVMAKRKNVNNRHITGLQLLNGMKQLLLGKYGCMVIDVLTAWNIYTTDDIGNIVFNLAEVQLLGTSENDRREDFHNRFSFHDAFVTPFMPTKRIKPMPFIQP
jgi:uncharacterized repeat protein (TIGR04138 family)